MSIRPRVAVIGGGAIGTVLAAAAEQAGHDVTVCVRAVPDALVLTCEDGKLRPLGVRMTAEPAKVRTSDWVLIATKAHDTATVATWLDFLAGADTTIVACQNGIGHECRLAPLAPKSKVMPAVVSIVAERTRPTHVVHFGGRRLAVADDDHGRRFAALMEGSGLDVHLEPDIHRAIWLKFMANIAAAPVTTLTSRRMDVLSDPAVQDLLRGLVSEAFAVGVAEGVNLKESDVEATMRLLAGLDPAMTTSMQADRSAGRSLEFEELSGALDRAAGKHGIEAPLNRAVLALLRCLRSPKG